MTIHHAPGLWLAGCTWLAIVAAAPSAPVSAQQRTQAGAGGPATALAIAEARAAEAEARAAEAEARAADAELRAAQAELRAARAELRAAEAEARIAALEAGDLAAGAAGSRYRRGSAAGVNADSRTDDEWQRALSRATRYRRPDRTSEDDLNDGSHFEQSSDDRSYRERCTGTPEEPGFAGFRYEIRDDTKSIHWRWKESTGGQWRAYFNDAWLGPVGERIVRVADTVAAWNEYRPPPSSEESEFVILIACTSSGWDEIDVHYHH